MSPIILSGHSVEKNLLFLNIFLLFLGPRHSFGEEKPAVGQTEKPEETVRLDATILMTFLDQKVILLWSEEHGYLRGECTDTLSSKDLHLFRKSINTSRRLRLAGTLQEGDEKTLAIQSVARTNGTTKWPPLLETPDLKNGTAPPISKINLEGTVEHCLDRKFSMHLLLRVDDTPFQVILRSQDKPLKQSIQTGQRMAISGYLWNPDISPQKTLPLTLCTDLISSIKLITPPSTPTDQPGEETTDTRVYTNMQYVGKDSTGTSLFKHKHSPLAIGLNLKPSLIPEKCVSRESLYNITARMTGQRRGYRFGKSLRIELIKRVTLNPAEDFDIEALPEIGTPIQYSGLVHSVIQR